MNSSLSLQVKGILVIGLLLLFELTFVGCYAALLIEADRESARQQTAKEIVSTASGLLKIFFEAGDNVAKYALKRDLVALGKYQEKSAELLRKIKWTKEQLRKDSEQYKLFERIEDSVTSSLRLFAILKSKSDSESELAVAKYGQKLKSKMRLELQEVSGNLVQFLDAEKQIESASPVAIKLQRVRTRWLLAGGIVLNIIVAFILVAWFLRSITSRLEIVSDNAERLRERKNLRVPLSGDDEIAAIDEAFHEMSHALQEEEHLVRASTELIQTIIDQMPIGLMLVDESDDEAKIDYANKSLERLLEYNSGELVQKSLSGVFTTSGGHSEPLSDTSVIEGPVELLAQKKSGSSLPVEFSLSDFNFETSKRLATVIDISEKHEIEKMKAAFVAMVSHDLRTPLTSVAGFFHMLPLGVYGQFSPAVIDQTKLAEIQVEELITLINDLLDLEKLKAGQLEMRPTKVSLEDLIDGAVDSCAQLAEELGVSVVFEGCPQEIAVQADQDRLSQALAKVLGSAIRLSNGGTVKVVVSLDAAVTEVTVDWRVAKLQMTDEQLEAIFEPFQAVPFTLGLALPLAQAILLSFGGTCGVAQEEQDLVLWVQLPVG
ncbi:MAG: histidine kinase dimerization/phospho-acceptor domain-containing protein [Candidatus Obscuribacterales bacterium]|jgi:signal transduction histidine kinase